MGRRRKIVEELLVLRCQEGSREAFRQLVERWQEPLWRHARRLTGRDDGAWDVLQDAWMAVASGIARLDDPARFRRWIYTIVTRRAADWQRERGREEAGLEVSEAEPVDPRSVMGDADDAELLRTALRRLPGERRALLSLHHLEGFELWEVAEIFGVPEGTVKSRLHQARNELRETVERMSR